MTGVLTVSIWHNVTSDAEGRHTGFGGFTPDDQMVKVFTYDTPASGRSPAGIAEDAFAAFNDAPSPRRPRPWPGSTGSGACGQYRLATWSSSARPP